MAQKSSFDLVSEVDMAEVTNAVDQASRELATRFDFKGTGTSIHQDADLVELRSSTEDRLKAALQVFREKCVKRKISLKALSEGPILPAAKATYRQSVHISQGIDQEKAREINRFIKDLKLKKVQTQVQGDKLRITAPKKDDLQEVIGALRERDFGIPLQFTNYR